MPSKTKVGSCCSLKTIAGAAKGKIMILTQIRGGLYQESVSAGMVEYEVYYQASHVLGTKS